MACYMYWSAIQMSTSDTWPDSSFVWDHLLYYQLAFCSFYMKNINMIILHLLKSLELLKFIVCTFHWNAGAFNGLTQNFTYPLQSTCVMKSISHLHLLFWFVKIECPADVQAASVITVRNYSVSCAHSNRFWSFKRGSQKGLLGYHTWKTRGSS